jgi:hypothetical protein
MNKKHTLAVFFQKLYPTFKSAFDKKSIALNLLSLAITWALIILATVNANAVCQTPQFALPIVLNVNRPVAAAPGDFNRDGSIDIAVLKIVTSTSFYGVVEIFLNNGNNIFTSTGIQYNAIPSRQQVLVYDLATADFNNDGRLDLVATGSANPTVAAILLGNGAGGFSLPTDFDVADGGVGVAVGDFNNDNNADIVTRGFNGASVLPGLGNGSFGGAVVVPLGAGGSSTKIEVRNFNNDNFLDFVSANTSSSTPGASIRLGNGSFIFSSPPAISSSSAFETTANDFNKDGKADIAIVKGSSSGSVSIHLGLGDGTFNSPNGSPFPSGGSFSSYIASADFNSDNLPDLAIGNGSLSNSLSILFGNGLGTFGTAFNFTPEPGFSGRVYAVDINQNDATDLVIVKAEAQNKVVVMLNTCPPASRNNFPDFDSDGLADISVFRPSNGTWYINRSRQGFTQTPFGIASDKIIPADFDGDGKTDIAVYRASDGVWYVLGSASNSVRTLLFGFPTDVPLPGDYDGDGKADIAVFRPSNGIWFVLGSANNNFSFTQFGLNGDIPIIGNFDGDNKTDLTVFRPSSGIWYILRSTQGFTSLQWGVAGDIPVAGDYDGDSKTDVGVFRNGTWFLQRSQLGFQVLDWGIMGDVPTPADYDGDGKTDIAVFRNGVWYLLNSQQGTTVIQFGIANDRPVPSAFIQ